MAKTIGEQIDSVLGTSNQRLESVIRFFDRARGEALTNEQEELCMIIRDHAQAKLIERESKIRAAHNDQS